MPRTLFFSLGCNHPLVPSMLQGRMTRTMVLGAMATWICLATALVVLSYLPIGVWAQPTLDSAAGRVFGPLSPRLPPPDLAPAVWHKAIRSWLKPPAPNWDGTECCHPRPSQLSEKLDLLRIFGPHFLVPFIPNLGPILSSSCCLLLFSLVPFNHAAHLPTSLYLQGS